MSRCYICDTKLESGEIRQDISGRWMPCSKCNSHSFTDTKDYYEEDIEEYSDNDTVPTQHG